MVDYDCALDFILADADDRETELRVRELRAIAALVTGWQSDAKRALDEAVVDHTKALEALRVIDALPTIPRRRVLAAYGSLAYGTAKRKGGEPPDRAGVGCERREACPLCGG